MVIMHRDFMLIPRPSATIKTLTDRRKAGDRRGHTFALDKMFNIYLQENWMMPMRHEHKR